MAIPLITTSFVVTNITVTAPGPEPLTDIARGALYKASESIKEGMWCAGSWFESRETRKTYDVGHLLGEKSKYKDTVLTLTDAIKSRRCAEGEVALQVALLGGDLDDYYKATNAVVAKLSEHCPACRESGSMTLAGHNDTHLLSGLARGEDPADSLSELFRYTADTAP